MSGENICLNCASWDVANAVDPKAREQFYEPDERPPHANQCWAACSAAMEGWAHDFDPSRHKMAVWDGSQYMAELLTHAEHGCRQFKPRSLADALAESGGEEMGR